MTIRPPRETIYAAPCGVPSTRSKPGLDAPYPKAPLTPLQEIGRLLQTLTYRDMQRLVSTLSQHRQECVETAAWLLDAAHALELGS